VLFEWLSSPLRYRDEPSLTEPLRAIVGDAAHLPVIEYHYDRITRRVFAEILKAAAPRLKSYFYALRPALALRWLRAHGAPPPMDLSSLMAGVDVPEQVERAVRELLARKADAREDDTTARVAILDAYLDGALSREVMRPLEKPDTSAAAERAQRFFASVLLAPARP
jgi:uncharacterized protein